MTILEPYALSQPTVQIPPLEAARSVLVDEDRGVVDPKQLALDPEPASLPPGSPPTKKPRQRRQHCAVERAADDSVSEDSDDSAEAEADDEVHCLHRTGRPLPATSAEQHRP